MTSKTTPGLRLAVVVCCFSDERRDDLDLGVRAVRDQLNPETDELIVVVDHNEGLQAWLSDHFPDGVTVVPNHEDRGLSGARNTGTAATQADVVVFLDDDATLRPDGLDAVRTAFADERIVAIGGAVHARWEAGAPPAWFPEEFGWVVGCDYRGLPPHGSEIRNPIGAAMAVRRDALMKAGGFSHRLGRVGSVPAGCEETLMGIELRRLFPDSRIVRIEDFAVDHTVPRSRAKLEYFTNRCLHEGRSKAILSAMVGAGAGLSAERSFVLRTLTTGAARCLGRGVTGTPSAFARAFVLVLGLFVTAFGTVSRSLTTRGAAAGTARPGSSTGRAATEAAITADELVSVVIATVGRPSLLDTAKAVLAQTHRNLELIVVDNRPQRGAATALVAELDDPRLRVVEEPVPGVSAARNRGAWHAHGRLVAFTDDDALPDPDWIARVLKTFVADENGIVGIVTGRVLGTDAATVEQEWFEEAKIFDKGTEATVWAMCHEGATAELGGYGPHGPFFPYTAGECGSGNNMVFRKTALASIGGFDERLGTGTPTRGGEDLDSFRAALLDGWAVAYNPLAVVRHYHRDNMDDLRVQSYGYGTGMAASLAKLLLSGPSGAWAIIRHFPRGLHMLLSPTSSKNVDLPREWPLELRVREAWGYLAGPVLYLRSRRHRVGSLDLT